jgi:type 1 fimbria pilin
MTNRISGVLLIALSLCSAEATAKNQGHGTLNLGGEIVETPCGIGYAAGTDRQPPQL